MKLELDQIKGSIPASEGIYFLYSEDIVIYIGSSSNLSSRLNPLRLFQEYFRYKLTHIQYFEININRLELEKNLIKMFQPLANATFNPNWNRNGQYRYKLPLEDRLKSHWRNKNTNV